MQLEWRWNHHGGHLVPDTKYSRFMCILFYFHFFLFSWFFFSHSLAMSTGGCWNCTVGRWTDWFHPGEGVWGGKASRSQERKSSRTGSRIIVANCFSYFIYRTYKKHWKIASDCPFVVAIWRSLISKVKRSQETLCRMYFLLRKLLFSKRADI